MAIPSNFPGHFTIISARTHTTPITLNDEQRRYVKILMDMKLQSILDEGEGEKTCKALGQEIFNKFKAKDGSSEAGLQAMKAICENLLFQEPRPGYDPRNYYGCVNRAWQGVGDQYEKWRA